MPSAETDSSFAYYSLLASRPVLRSLGKGSTFMELTPTDLGSHPLPLPPPAEQRAIAAFLDERLERIDALTARVEAAVERLQEYRTALVTAVVTGKIDVRGDVPDEAGRVGA